MTNRRCGWRAQFVGGLVLGVAMIAAQPAAAQSTIFNIPTTDTVSPKKGYFEFDYLAQAPTPDVSSWQNFMPRVVIGAGSKAEFGVNFANTKYSDDGGTYAQMQPNVKVKLFANDDAGVAVAAGGILYSAINNRDSISDTDFGMVYGLVSKKVTDGPRFHAGIYGSIDYADDEQVGAILGYEQPIVGSISFVADWFSGKNFWGYFTPGVSIVLPRSGLLNIGYSLGNDSYDGNKNRALFVYYGVVFP